MQNSEKTVYVHIGFHKTGTTSIQQFLFENRETLEEVLYPILNDDKLYPFVKNAQHINLRPFFNENEVIEDNTENRKKFKDAFIRQMESFQGKKIVLSEEHLCINKKNRNFVLSMLQEYNFIIKIIVYIRPMAEWCASDWNQQLRNYRKSNTISLDDFLLRNDIRHEAAFASIEQLGKENVIVRPYEKCQWKNGNLIEDFLDVVGLPFEEEKYKTIKKQNVGVGRNTSELLRLINYLNLPNLNFYRRKIYALSVRDIKVIETFTDSQILEITEKYADVLKKLANIYGKESLFVNELPSCYGKERPVYDKVTLSAEQYTILLEAFEENKKEKEEMRLALAKLSKKYDKPSCDVNLAMLVGWDEAKALASDSVMLTMEQHAALIAILEANRQEKEWMAQELGLPFNVLLYDLGKAMKKRRKLTFLEKVFSVRREKGYKVLRILGLKMRFKRS